MHLEAVATKGAIITAAAFAVYLVTACLVVPGAAAAGGPQRSVEGCLIVTHPTLQRHTSCSGVLSGAGLANTNLSYADLSGATLRGAHLSGSDLSGADLSGADLSGADLTGADLSGADLTHAMLAGVVWRHTRCPDGAHSDQVGGTCFYDLNSLVGAAVGSAPQAASAGTGPGSSSAAEEVGSLAFTGQATWNLAAVGFGAVAAGLLMIRVSSRSRRRRAGAG